MACGRTIGTLSAFRRVTVLSSTDVQFFPTTKWLPLTGLAMRAWVNVLDEGGQGVSIRPAFQYAQVVTDQPANDGGRDAWTGTGIAVTTEGIHAFGDIVLGTSHQWVRFGFEAKAGGALGFGQADVSVMFEVKPCGKWVGLINKAGVEADATREVPLSRWFPTVDVTNVRIGYMLDADNDFKIEWYIQTANDTNRPAQPTSLSASATGSGAGTYTEGNTGDVDISSITTPATAADTPAFARIMGRISTTGASPVTADQLVVNVQVS